MGLFPVYINRAHARELSRFCGIDEPFILDLFDLIFIGEFAKCFCFGSYFWAHLCRRPLLLSLVIPELFDSGVFRIVRLLSAPPPIRLWYSSPHYKINDFLPHKAIKRNFWLELCCCINEIFTFGTAISYKWSKNFIFLLFKPLIFPHFLSKDKVYKDMRLKFCKKFLAF